MIRHLTVATLGSRSGNYVIAVNVEFKSNMKNTVRIFVFMALMAMYQSCNFNHDTKEKTSEIRDSVANASSALQRVKKEVDSITLRTLLLTIYKC